MESVETAPFFSMEMYVPRLPFCRTMFVWIPDPSRTCATSCT